MDDNARKTALQMMMNQIREYFKSGDWYSYVQEDVAKRIEWVMQNVETVGSSFRQTFEVIFDWTRLCLANTKPDPQPESIVPPLLKDYMIAEPVFRCGRWATKIALDLEEFTDPRDPDVKAAIHLCHHIGILESKGLILTNEHLPLAQLVKLALDIKAGEAEEPKPAPEHVVLDEENPQDDDDVI